LGRNYPANYDTHARTVAGDAYWSQVRRTINGKPVSEAQIMMIVDAIVSALSLQPQDVVLDLACGNGALSSYLYDKCAGLVGVDISPYLIEIARRDFARPPNYRFEQDDVIFYLAHGSDDATFSKALIYGSFQYLSRVEAVALLELLGRRFVAVVKIFIGNVPNKRLVDRFYLDGVPSETELNDPEARIGVWYAPEEIEAMAEATGWRASLSHMPADFYTAHYRFDVTLERSAS
jgi:SAM-dependent methyltransferase